MDAETTAPVAPRLFWLVGGIAAVATLTMVLVDDLRIYGHVIGMAGVVLIAPFGVFAWRLWRWHGRSDRLWPAVLGVAVVLRLVLLFGATPSLSDDIYRYVWDGWQQRHGVNPYRYAPDAPEVALLRDPLWERVNHKEVPTIYPPLAEAMYFAVDVVSHSERAQRAALVLCDIVLIVVLGALCQARGVPRARAALYAWHPLPLLEIAGQGHNDSLPLLFLVLALLLHERGHGGRSLLALAASTASKFFGAAAAPLIALRHPRRVWLVFPIAVCAAYLPYVGAGPKVFQGLSTYATHWEFNHSLFRVADLGLRATGAVDPRFGIKLAFAVCGALVLVGLCVKRVDPVPGAVILIAVAMLTSPTVHPWYILWCLVLLPCVRSWGLLAWSCTVVLSYQVMPRWVAHGVWEENLWIVAAEYVPVFILLAHDCRRAISTRAAAESNE